jgi:hypothetical protein
MAEPTMVISFVMTVFWQKNYPDPSLGGEGLLEMVGGRWRLL